MDQDAILEDLDSPRAGHARSLTTVTRGAGILPADAERQAGCLPHVTHTLPMIEEIAIVAEKGE
jgi:hypothetical protein